MNLFIKYWPNVKFSSRDKNYDKLWAHEWEKHGTCSGLKQYDYFNTTLSLIQKFGTPDYVRSNVNKFVDAAKLRDAFGGKEMTALQCNVHPAAATITNDGHSMHHNPNHDRVTINSNVLNKNKNHSRSPYVPAVSSPSRAPSNSPVSNTPSYYLDGVFTCWSQINNKPNKRIPCPTEVLNEDTCHASSVFIKSF